MKGVINTSNAPAAIGTYSQAVKANGTLYVSGQIPLDPVSMTVVSEEFEQQAKRVFQNLQAVIEAANMTLNNVVKLTVYLKDLSQFALVNEIMAQFFQEPYPARAAVEVSRLPKDVLIEVDAVCVL